MRSDNFPLTDSGMTEALINGTGVASSEVVVITTGITMVQVVTEV